MLEQSYLAVFAPLTQKKLRNPNLKIRMIGIGNSSRQWQSDCGGTTGQSHIVN